MTEHAKALQQKRIQQLALRHVGNGPAASTGEPGSGWRMSADIYFRCVKCNYFMTGDPEVYDDCFCGRMHKDAGAGRFGSDLGDDAIEVYVRC